MLKFAYFIEIRVENDFSFYMLLYVVSCNSDTDVDKVVGTLPLKEEKPTVVTEII